MRLVTDTVSNSWILNRVRLGMLLKTVYFEAILLAGWRMGFDICSSGWTCCRVFSCNPVSLSVLSTQQSSPTATGTTWLGRLGRLYNPHNHFSSPPRHRPSFTEFLDNIWKPFDFESVEASVRCQCLFGCSRNFTFLPVDWAIHFWL